MIKIEFTGDAEMIRTEMAAVLGVDVTPVARVVGQHTSFQQTATVEPAAAKSTRATKPKTEKQSIQTGDDRVGPQDTPETERQDAADEAADKKPAAKLSHDDVRAALGRYVQKFGMPAAQEDGPKVLALIFGADIDKVSLIKDGQDELKKAVEGINEMTKKNPYKRLFGEAT